MRAWLALTTVRALFCAGAATRASPRSLLTQGDSVCRTPLRFFAQRSPYINQDTRGRKRWERLRLSRTLSQRGLSEWRSLRSPLSSPSPKGAKAPAQGCALHRFGVSKRGSTPLDGGYQGGVSLGILWEWPRNCALTRARSPRPTMWRCVLTQYTHVQQGARCCIITQA
jgi:hypothetical protein